MTPNISEPPVPPTWPALSEAAATAGVDQVCFLVQQAAILGALAGPESGWSGPAGLDRTLTPNLLLPESGTLQGRLTQNLLNPARDIQGRLRKHSGTFRHEMLEFIRHGKHPNKAKDGDAHRHWQANQRYSEALHEDRSKLGHESYLALDQAAGGGGSLAHDIEQSVPAVREEALRHPSFLLANPSLAHLARQAPALHLGRGLIVGSLGCLLRKPRRGNKSSPSDARRPLLDYIKGFDTQTAVITDMHPLNTEVHVKACAVLTATDAELARLADADRQLLDKFVIVRSAGPPPPSDVPLPDDDQSLLDLMPHTLRSLLSQRRNGVGVVHGMRDPGKARLFHHQVLTFLAELDVQQAPVHDLAAVPTSIAWTVSLLYRHHDVDDLILKVAVPYARILLARHLEALDCLKQAEEEEVHLEREIAIVEKIRRHGPMKDRDLLRKFHDQRKDVHQPAIDRLLEEGVLVRDDLGRLGLGPEVEAFERSVAECAC